MHASEKVVHAIGIRINVATPIKEKNKQYSFSTQDERNISQKGEKVIQIFFEKLKSRLQYDQTWNFQSKH